MFDPTIHKQTIARQFRAADFKADHRLFIDAERLKVVTAAVAIGKSGFSGISLKTAQLRGKRIYQVSSLEQDLVVRHLTNNIRRVTNVKQDNRQFIVSCLKLTLSSGLPFRAYKLDIKSFYESVSVDDIVSRLGSDIAFSGQASRTLESLGGVDKVREGDSPDAVRCDSKLIFLVEIGGGSRAVERRRVGILRAVRDRGRAKTGATACQPSRCAGRDLLDHPDGGALARSA